MKYQKFILNTKLKEANSVIHQLEAEKEFIYESFYFHLLRTDKIESETLIDYHKIHEYLQDNFRKATKNHRNTDAFAFEFIYLYDRYFSKATTVGRERLDFFSAIFLAYLYQRDIEQKIKSLRKTVVFLQKCKDASFVTDKRITIRHNIKNNLYRRSDEGDHLLTNIPDLFLARYWFEQIHKHHEKRKHKKSNRRHTMRPAIQRAGLERDQQAAFGMC